VRLPLDRCLHNVGPLAALVGAGQPRQQFACGGRGGRHCAVVEVARAQWQVARLAVVETFALDMELIDQALGQVVRGQQPLKFSGRGVQFEQAKSDLRVIAR